MAKRQAPTLEEISAEVGRLFGTTESHARRWLEQRKTLLEALGTVRDKASALMSELSGQNPFPLPGAQRKRGRLPAAVPASPLTDTPRKRKGRRKIIRGDQSENEGCRSKTLVDETGCSEALDCADENRGVSSKRCARGTLARLAGSILRYDQPFQQAVARIHPGRAVECRADRSVAPVART